MSVRLYDKYAELIVSSLVVAETTPASEMTYIVAETTASTHCTYPRRDGQAEWSWT